MVAFWNDIDSGRLRVDFLYCYFLYCFSGSKHSIKEV